MTEQEIIEHIFEKRVKNNIPWKGILEIALKHAPEETKAVLREINQNDMQISFLMWQLSQ